MTTPYADFGRNLSDIRPNFYTEGTNYQSDNSLNISLSSEVSSIAANTQASSISAKPHMLPFVYFQAQNNVAKPTSNVILNTVQLSNNMGTNLQNTSIQNNQNVILTKPQQLVMQKTTSGGFIPINVSTNSLKNTVALFLKPVGNTQEALPVTGVPLKHATTEHIQVIPNMANVSQKPGQKYLLAPMPKISTNRLPVTATTNSNVQSKIAFMPLHLQSSVTQSTDKSNMINFKISNGVVCDPRDMNSEAQKIDTSLLCTETLSLSSPEKGKEDKSYQLSIVEDSSSRQEPSYTLSIPEETKQDPAKYVKQGISILKKNFSMDRRSVLQINSNISLSSNVKATPKPLSDCDENSVSTPVFKNKPGRRRKSQFAYRKEYDEIEQENKIVTSTPKQLSVDNAFTKFLEAELEAVKNCEKEEMEMNEDIKTDEFLKYDGEEAVTFTWDQGVGSMPGSYLKFEVNEFGLLEILAEEELKRYKPVEKPKEQVHEDLCCESCGCYGMQSDFITTKYCSTACQEVGEKARAKKRKRNMCKNDSSDEEDKVYPWNCKKKGFSWAKYLDHTKSTGAPIKLFKDPFPYNRNGFRVGMKLEGIDPLHPKYYCVLTVHEVVGYRIRLHFDGYPDNYDYWKNADSLDIFPMGWCEKNNHTLHPPSSFKSSEFNWNTYLKSTKSIAAPKQLFAIRLPNHCPNAFRVGMKLEAVDRKNTSLVCVATIANMMDNRILVHFDSWDDIYDYWAEPTSPYIHPVGWCDEHGHNLTPPNDYPSPKDFTWQSYLRETKSVAAPVRAFKQRPANGFKVDMKLECVDKRVPHLIRVATVIDVVDHRIKIRFDGWPEKYSYWVDDDCTDIHPMGWCHKTGHPLEPPLTPDNIYDFLECATVGCRGLGHIQGPKYSVHSSTKFCPYADENLELDRALPDRLQSPDREVESVVPVSREPQEVVVKKRVGRPPKVRRGKRSIIPKPEVDAESDEDNEKLSKRSKSESLKSFSPPPEPEEKVVEDYNGYSKSTIADAKLYTSWEKHCQHLESYVNVNSNPKFWSEQEVINFVNSIPSCRGYDEEFLLNRIDGESLLMLTTDDLVNVLNMKIGPAVKLYNSILLLRQYMLREFT